MANACWCDGYCMLVCWPTQRHTSGYALYCQSHKKQYIVIFRVIRLIGVRYTLFALFRYCTQIWYLCVTNYDTKNYYIVVFTAKSCWKGRNDQLEKYCFPTGKLFFLNREIIFFQLGIIGCHFWCIFIPFSTYFSWFCSFLPFSVYCRKCKKTLHLWHKYWIGASDLPAENGQEGSRWDAESSSAWQEGFRHTPCHPELVSGSVRGECQKKARGEMLK
jgi:hypothetical protein